MQTRRVIAVGYNAATFGSDMQVLRGASFITIGVKDAQDNPCVRLSDLKVVGYTGNVGGESIKIAPLERNGSNQQIEVEGESYDLFYFWRDNKNYPAGWYGLDDEPMKDGSSICGDADDITFPVGQGICFVVSSSFSGAAIQSSGEVIQSKSSYIFPMDMQNLVCNPLARTISLSEITVSGYTGNVGGESIKIAPLERNGSNQQIEVEGESYDLFYFWRDNKNYPAGWYGLDDNPMKNGESLCGDADKIFYQPGEAMCFVVSSGFIGCQVDFPSLGLTTAE